MAPKIVTTDLGVLVPVPGFEFATRQFGVAVVPVGRLPAGTGW